MSIDADIYIHPNALVESDEVGAGTRIWAFAHVMKGARIGSGCNLCDHTFIESNVTLGNNVTVKNGVAIWDKVEIADDVFIGPYAVFTNDPNPRIEAKKPRELWVPTFVRRGASIGANATIVCGVTLGSYSFIAAGAVVTRDVPDHALVMGVPGRIRGWMCHCGGTIRLGSSAGVCTACDARYKRGKSGLVEVLHRRSQVAS